MNKSFKNDRVTKRVAKSKKQKLMLNKFIVVINKWIDSSNRY